MVRWILRAAVVLMPIFFLPVGNFPQELSKTIIFDALVLLAAGVFLFGFLKKNSGRIYSHPILWLVGLLCIFFLVSGSLSVNRYASFIGSGGVYSTNVMTLVAYILFFLLLINTVRSEGEWRWLVSALVLSESIAVIFSILQGYGLHLLPWSATQDVRFNMIASSSLTLAVVASLCCALALGLFWQYTRRIWKIIWVVALGLNVLLVMTSGKPPAVYLLLFILFIFSVAVSWQARKFAKWEILVPLSAIVLLALGLLIQFPQLTHVQNSTSLLLDQRTSMGIAWRSIVHAPLWGSGPQTFAEDFQQYRPASFNDTPNAGVRFNKSGSEWWGQLTTLGVIAVLAQLAIGVWFAVRAGKRLRADWRVGERQWTWPLAVLVVFLGLWAAYFFMPFNAFVYFIWWLWLGINFHLVRPDTGREKNISLRRFRPTWFVVSAGMLVILAASIFFGYFGVRVWLGDYNFFRANQLIQQKAEVGDIQRVIRAAIAENPHEPAYPITLAQSHAAAAQLEAAKNDPDQAVMRQEVQDVVDALGQAREIAPNSAIVYEQTAGLYDGLRNLIGNVDELASSAYAKLTELEPTNPLAFLNLGRAQLIQAQAGAQATDEDAKKQSAALITAALDNFRTSKSLQHDYYLADLNIATALEAQGDLAGAKAALEEARRIKPDEKAITAALDALNKKITSEPD